MIDDEARKPTNPFAADLSPLSLDELEERIGELEAEIARVRAEIDKKQRHRDSVADIFSAG